MQPITLAILILESLGTIAFAISGAMQAINKKLDIFGIIILAMITATGGGMMRDIILGINPPKAFTDPIYCILAVLTALCVAIIVNKRKKPLPYLDIINLFDAFGLAIFCITGANASIALYPQNMFLCIFVGVLTGIGGGILRDMLSASIPSVLKKELYAVPAIFGTVCYYLGRFHFSYGVSVSIGILLIVSIRLYATKKEMSLPIIELETKHK